MSTIYIGQADLLKTDQIRKIPLVMNGRMPPSIVLDIIRQGYSEKMFTFFTDEFLQKNDAVRWLLVQNPPRIQVESGIGRGFRVEHGDLVIGVSAEKTDFDTYQIMACDVSFSIPAAT